MGWLGAAAQSQLHQQKPKKDTFASGPTTFFVSNCEENRSPSSSTIDLDNLSLGCGPVFFRRPLLPLISNRIATLGKPCRRGTPALTVSKWFPFEHTIRDESPQVAA